MESKSEFVQAQTTSEIDEATGGENFMQPLHTDDQRRRTIEQLYTSLEPWETRLIALQPGQFDDPLVAHLQTAVITLEEGFGLVNERRSVQHEALSYTWGGEVLSHPLTCNGLTIGITQNLSTALRYLRLVDDVRYLWVDAVCINQANNEEKSRQIRNLRLVFGHARQVVAWLGEQKQNTPLAVKALKSAGEQHEYKRVRGDDLGSPSSHLTKTMSSMSSEEKLTVGDALLDFLGRPWFSRAWIVQEVCAAKSISIQCGRCAIDWKAFSTIFGGDKYVEVSKRSLAHELITAALGFPSSADPPPGNKISETTAIDFLARSRRYTQQRQAKSQVDAVQDLYDLVKSTAHLKATDPRDRIWALVGLTNLSVSYGSDGIGQTREDKLCIDYSKPRAQVFAELTKFFLVSFGYPKSLLLPHRYGESSPSSAPSWSIDFEEMNLPYHRQDRLQTVSNASDHELAAPSTSNSAWEVLTLEGWHIGTFCASARKSAGDRARMAALSQPDYASYELEDLYCGRGRIHFTDKTVRNTPCLREWLLRDAGSNVKWNDASLSLVDFLGRKSGSFREKVKVDVKTLVNKNARFVPQTGIEAYVDFRAENRWGVPSSVQNGDIVVHFDLCDAAYVLRETDSGYFKCLGKTEPIKNILVRAEIDSYENPAHGYPVPERNSPNESKYKRPFHIC